LTFTARSKSWFLLFFLKEKIGFLSCFKPLEFAPSNWLARTPQESGIPGWNEAF
jgi:hypothetical protein